MADELDGMATFVAVAEAKGFRAAGERLGVSGPAVSKALRKLEEYCTPFPGFYLYSLQRRHAPSLRALVDNQHWARQT